MTTRALRKRDAAFLRRRVRLPSERSACDNAPPHLGMSFAAAGVDITASNKRRGQGCPERVTLARRKREVPRAAFIMKPRAGHRQGQVRRALPWHHPEHGHHVPQGHLRKVHARQHALQRNAARSAQSTSRTYLAISSHLDDPDAVRQHSDRQHLLAEALSSICAYRSTVGEVPSTRSAKAS